MPAKLKPSTKEYVRDSRGRMTKKWSWKHYTPSATPTEELDAPIRVSFCVIATVPDALTRIAFGSPALPICPSFATLKDPPLTAPVVVIVEEPVSIVPKPDVIEPPSRAPTDVTFPCAAV